LLQAAVYDKTPTQVANSVAAAAAGLATGPFLWAWLSRRFGRTSVIFWAMLCNLGVNIWSASMTKSDQYTPFVVSRWLGGTFGSCSATIGAGIILDVFYLHQRGKGENMLLVSRLSA
jgi:MFS family permease